MLASFRSFVRSRVGVVLTLIVLVLIALAFAAGDISGLRPQGAALVGGTVVEVGDATVTDAELTTRAQNALDQARQQQPTLDMGALVAAGGFESVVSQVIQALSLEEFAAMAGMEVSQAAIDGQIASIPAFQGFDGKFNQDTYERLLADRRITTEQLRTDIRREILTQWLIAPTIGASQVSPRLALPYASLLLERRQGSVGIIPSSAVPAPAAPTDQQLASYYSANRSRYTVSERRAIRYALVSPERFAAGINPTDAELQAAYQARRAEFAATETRTIEQVIVADQNAASQLAAKVQGGTPLAAAAQAIGLEASTQTAVRKQAYAAQSSPAVADAAFAAPEGSVVGPVRGTLGFVVLRVADVEQVAGRSIADVRDTLVTELRRTKALEALTALQEQLDNGITDGSTFDELIADAKLQAVTTPPLTADGRNPDNPQAEIDPALTRVVQAAYATEPGDSPQLVQTAQDGTFALVGLANVLPPAPRPLGQIRDRVVADWTSEQAKQAARKIALGVIAKVNRGTSLAQAIATSGVRAPAPEALDATRAQLAAQGQQLPPPVTLMFSMAPKTAKLVEAPNNGGWFVVYLDAIESGDAKGNERAIASTRAGLGSVIGREYAEQFAMAAQRSVGVRRDEAALARVKAQLAGQGVRP
ncbi:peptidylprolyl isomerase [Sphingomonas japonica]|uniref:Parvulin-like PPIase n=1 Tax=Sphingomonas japonica TaxID=511662 RepID=A0ABX0U3G9_9SPHN|nr:peptidylprolyl isomerase [Sphingomonas japonica]NIJ24595.1 peptidyl-prolyl cis-trans isomerase D [Sphingomonas japonica]